MSGRYGGWRRLSGATAERPDLLDLGKKLLAEVDTQRQLSGVKTLSQRRTLPDGSVVEAGFTYDHPWINVTAGPKEGGRIEARSIEGFIVRPSDATDQWENADLNHVVLTPSGSGFVAAFYDEAHRPAGYDSRPLYGEWLPDGLLRYGNVDWRPADESVWVSWMGPSGRYFGYGFGSYGAGPWVFLHGKVLFDCENPEHVAVLDGIANGGLIVRGACILRAGLASHLLVALRDDNIGEYLLRVRLESPTMQTKLAGLGVQGAAHEFADVEVLASSAELLLVAESDFPDGYHPYCFNSDGTEARRIFYKSGTTYEVQIIEDADGVWSRNVVEATTYGSTETWSAERAYAPAGSYALTYWVDSGGGTFTSHSMSGHHHQSYDEGTATETVGTIEPITLSSISYTNVPEATTQKFAVDFWNGEWRYAHQHLSVTTNTSNYACDMSVNSSRDTGYFALGPSGPGGEDGPFIGEPATFDATLVMRATLDESFVQIDGGIQCDFLSQTFGDATQTAIVYTLNESQHELLPFATELDTSHIYDEGNESDRSWSASYSRSVVETNTDLYLNFLDLRFNCASYQTRVETTTTTVAGSESASRTSLMTGGVEDVDTVGDYDASYKVDGMPVDISTQVVWTTRNIVNGVQLEEIVQADVPSGSSTSEDFDGDIIDWLGLWLSGTGYLSTTQIVSNTTWLSEMGSMLSSVGPHVPWHAVYVSLGDPAGTPSPLTYTDTNSGSSTFFDPTPDGVTTTTDHAGIAHDGYGSWLPVKSAWIAAFTRPENRDGQDEYASLGSHAGLDALLAAYPGAVRLNPVGYLSRVIVARKVP